jgi:DNA (cytosine-5)-methyltransferase 1
MALTFGSLFAGVGGFDMGFEQAGFECKFQVEWDKNCRTILDRHWPDVEKWGDIINVNGRFLPPVDVIIFGSPCQDLSVAGKRAGLEGERSGLFHEAVRIIKEMRDATNGTFPRWTVWENVAGALSSNNGRDFGTVINEMAKAGAHLQEYALLDAQHFGIPQRRRRVFLISCFDSATADKCPDTLLPVTESLPRDTKKGKQKRQSAASTLTEGVGTDGAWWDGRDTAEALTTTSNEQRMPDKQRFQAVVEQNVVGALAARDYKGVGNQYVAENKCVVEPMPTQKPSGWSLVPVGVEWFSDSGVPWDGQPILLDGTRVDDVRVYEPPVQTLKQRMGTGGNNVPMFISEPVMAVRRLTPLECERLMGWPDDHTRFKADGTEQADTHRYKQCGNGVASPFAKWVASHIAKVEHGEG